MNVNRDIPILFQKLNTYEAEDTRFLKVKIWLMHLGENLNGSYFDKPVVESAIPSLANTPILAYIEDNSSDEKDFSDHRQVLVKEDGQYKVKYLGQAIGVIPSENNAQFEMRLCDDGVEREFLTVEGLVWASKWDDPIDIFNRDIIKNQSMELHSEYTGEWKEDKLFHFTSFSFYGACALGKDVLPAMRNATIEAQFNYDNMFAEINNKVEQYKILFSKSSPSGDDNITSQEGGITKLNIEELLAKYSLSVGDLKEKGIEYEQFSLEELEAKIQETFKEEDAKTDFALTYTQLKDELRAELYKEKQVDTWGYEYTKYWFVDFDDQKVVAEDGEDNYRLISFTYSVNGDKVSIDFASKQRVKIAYLPFEGDVGAAFDIVSKERQEYELKVKEKEVGSKFEQEKELAVNELKEQFTSLESEVVSLREFKQQKISEERQVAETELFEKFSSKLTEDEMKEIKEKSSDFTLEEIELKLFALVGKKTANFSTSTKKKDTVKIDLDDVTETKQHEKPYAHLVEKYTKN